MPRWTQTDEERFWSKVTKTNDCWVWIAGLTPDGYGKFWYDGRHVLAHRWAFPDEIADGLELDHLCRNRACVRPSHLEAVNRGENQARGLNGYALRGNTCIRGHDMTNPENVVTRDSGRRQCRACWIARGRERSVCPVCGQERSSMSRHLRKVHSVTASADRIAAGGES